MRLQVSWAAPHTLASCSEKDAVVRMYNFDTEDNYVLAVSATATHCALCPVPGSARRQPTVPLPSDQRAAVSSRLCPGRWTPARAAPARRRSCAWPATRATACWRRARPTGASPCSSSRRPPPTARRCWTCRPAGRRSPPSWCASLWTSSDLALCACFNSWERRSLTSAPAHQRPKAPWSALCEACLCMQGAAAAVRLSRRPAR